MISNYKKLSIKNILLGITVVIVISGLSILINTSKVKSAAIQTPLTSNKIASLDSKSIIPFSSNIVIYNSEPYENYPSGKKITRVTDIGNLLSMKLKEKGINSNFVSNTVTKERPSSLEGYYKTYDVTRDLIKQNVKDYKNSILLDICCVNGPTKNIIIALDKTNPHYAENKKFADSLVAQFNKLNQPVVIEDIFHNRTYFNQDLSNESILIEIGNAESSDSELTQVVNTVATALENVQNGL